jgi:hypothetical protein
MKKSLVLAMAMALGVTASAYAANPFSDVPAGHWAYDSINKLAAAGVIEGYGDTTFGGDKLMTRYEMAQIVAKAMAKGANVDKLAAEFADELDNLGVRVANLEKKADNVKISGETKLRYWAYDGDGVAKESSDKLQQRSRVWVTGAINEDWTYKGMIENIQTYTKSNVGEEDAKFQRAYVQGKIGGIKVSAGRQELCDFNGGLIYDTRWDGVFASYGKDVKLTLGAGKAADSTSSFKAKETYLAELGAKLGVVEAKVGYYKFEDVGAKDEDKDAGTKDEDKDAGTAAVNGKDDEIWTVGVAFPIVKDLKLSGTYLHADLDDYNGDDDGFVIGLDYKGAKASKVGSYGIFAKYYDQGYGTYIAPTFEADTTFTGEDGDGFKGYLVGANYTFAKNIVGAVKYYDLEAKKGDKDGQTLYAELNFMF